MLVLDKEISAGLNKRCYLHPEDSTKIIKVNQPNHQFMLSTRDRFIKKLTGLYDFESSLDYEFWRYQKLYKKYKKPLLEIIPQCHGFIETNHGKGLVFDKVMNEDGAVSNHLHSYIDTQLDEIFIQHLKQAFIELHEKVTRLNVSLHDFNLRNFLFQSVGGKYQLIFVDIESLDHPRHFIPVEFIFLKKGLVRKRLKRFCHVLLERLTFPSEKSRQEFASLVM